MNIFKYRKGVSIFLFLIGMVPIKLVCSTPVILDNNKTQFPIGKNLEILEDKERGWSAAQVNSPDFKEKWRTNKDEKPNLGFTSSAYWVRFSTVNPDNLENIFFEYGYPPLDKIELFAMDKNNSVVFHKIAGDSIAYEQRDIVYKNVIFDLETDNKNIHTYLVKLTTTSSMNIDIVLWRYIPLLEKIDREQGVVHLYIGLLVALLIFNLFLLIAARDINYLYYSLFIFTSILLDYTLLGNAYKILTSKALFFANNNIPLLINLTNITGLIFSRSFLGTKKISKIMDIYLLVLIAAFAGLITYNVFGSYSSSIRISMPFSFLEYFSLLTIGTIAYIKGNKAAKFYLIAFAVLLAFSIIIVLKTVGILPVNFFTTYAMYLGRASNAVLLAFALADRINIARQEKEQALNEKLIHSEKVANMSRAFQRFVPLKFLDLLQKEDVTKVMLGDYVSKEMTILFSDIRSFTALSETMSPEDNFKFINSYLSRMEPPISQHHGFIDKFLGDAIMALFDRNAEDAIESAVLQQKIVVDYNIQRQKYNYIPINIGIGINTGPLMLGTIGAHERMEGTVISDAVNLASRMEGLTVKYQAKILISDNTYDALQDPGRYNIRKIDRVRVKGKTRPVTVYEVLDGIFNDNKSLKIKTLKTFQEGLLLFQSRKFDLSRKAFTECLSANPHDRVADIYVKRCEHMLKQTGSLENFDGVTNYHEK